MPPLVAAEDGAGPPEQATVPPLADRHLPNIVLPALAFSAVPGARVPGPGDPGHTATPDRPLLTLGQIRNWQVRQTHKVSNEGLKWLRDSNENKGTPLVAYVDLTFCHEVPIGKLRRLDKATSGSEYDSRTYFFDQDPDAVQMWSWPAMLHSLTPVAQRQVLHGADDVTITRFMILPVKNFGNWLYDEARERQARETRKRFPKDAPVPLWNFCLHQSDGGNKRFHVDSKGKVCFTAQFAGGNVLPPGKGRGMSSGPGSFTAGLHGGYPTGDASLPNMLLSLPPSEPASAPVGEPDAGTGALPEEPAVVETPAMPEEPAVVEDGPTKWGWQCKYEEKNDKVWFLTIDGNVVPDNLAKKHIDKYRVAMKAAKAAEQAAADLASLQYILTPGEGAPSSARGANTQGSSSSSSAAAPVSPLDGQAAALSQAKGSRQPGKRVPVGAEVTAGDGKAGPPKPRRAAPVDGVDGKADPPKPTRAVPTGEEVTPGKPSTPVSVGDEGTAKHGKPEAGKPGEVGDEVTANINAAGRNRRGLPSGIPLTGLPARGMPETEEAPSGWQTPSERCFPADAPARQHDRPADGRHDSSKPMEKAPLHRVSDSLLNLSTTRALKDLVCYWHSYVLSFFSLPKLVSRLPAENLAMYCTDLYVTVAHACVYYVDLDVCKQYDHAHNWFRKWGSSVC